MSECACGCGEEAKKGKYLHGHEKQLRKNLEEKIGSLQLLSALVKVTETYAQGRMSEADLGRLVKLIYSKK
jgi:hypothetical protein